MRRCLFERCRSVGGDVNLESGEAQRGGKQLADVGLVFHNKESGLGGGWGHGPIL